MRYFIAAPGGLASGGPELLHQFCHRLTELGYEAKMLYYYMTEETAENPVHPNYRGYRNGYVLDTESVDCEDACLIVPEPVSLLILNQMHRCKKVIWWLSVDFFYEHHSVRDGMKLKDMDMVHFTQCRYAYAMLHGIFGVPEEKIRFLSDYLRPEFMEEAERKSGGQRQSAKQNFVVYNPKKGKEITEYLIKQGKDLLFVPLIYMTPAEVSEKLCQAKVYIDFGSHPGKDRIPREAAVCGCCVITGRNGSAAYEEDVPIPKRYKFQDGIAQSEEVLALIRRIFEDYETCQTDFEHYRQVIKGEKERFDEDSKRIMEEIESGRF